jgi:hypothetical protein
MDQLLYYKKMCNQVWDKKCTQDLPTDVLLDYGYYARKCVEGRTVYKDNCCRGYADSGHLGAILKMKKIWNRCEKEYQKRIAEPRALNANANEFVPGTKLNDE